MCLRTPVPMPAVAITPDHALRDVLALVSPEKSASRQACGTERIWVDFAPSAPFGPSFGQLSSCLGVSLGEALQLLRQRAGVSVAVTGLDAERQVEVDDACYRRRLPTRVGDLVLSPLELVLLAHGFSTGRIQTAVTVSVFLGPGRVIAFLVPRGHSLRDVLFSADAIRAYTDKHPGATLTHPLSGRTVAFDDPCTAQTDVLCFSGAGYALLPPASVLFAFPAFNRRLAMRRGESHPGESRPCANCLACSRHCPAGLRPAFLYHNLQADDAEEALALGLHACTSCGHCTVACPSRLPLCETIATGLTAVLSADEEQ